MAHAGEEFAFELRCPLHFTIAHFQLLVLLLDLLLLPLTFRDILNKCIEDERLPKLDRSNRHFNREFAAVATQGINLNSPVNHLALTGREEMLQPTSMMWT